MNPYERQWLKERNLNLEKELEKSKCIRTNRRYHGVLNEITFALIDHPQKVIWWYKHAYTREKNI